MENDLSEWGRYLRVGIAGLLFVGLVIGGGAAALAALGAGLDALSGGQTAVQQQIAAVPAASSPAVTTSSPAQTDTARATAQGAVTTSPPSSNTAQTHASTGGLHSPVGDAIDAGGVVIGNHVQSAFGNVLSHMLNILFMEQDSATAAGSSQP